MPHRNKIKDLDAVFEINPITRDIKNVSTSKRVLVQYDHNSERFTFSLPRYIEGHDMTECNRVQVHYETNGGYKDCVELPALVESEKNPDSVVCTWLVSQNATRDIGALKFLLKFACVNNDTGEYEYIWSTGLFNGISVSEGMNNVAGVDDIPPDFLYSITQQLESKVDKDERFKLAYVSDAGTNKVLFIGNSNDSQGVNFYSKEQTDAALDNKVDKMDGLYLVKPISKKTSSNHPDGQKEWTGMSLMHSTDYSKRSDVIIPAYTSDLENDSGFVTNEQMNEAISGIQGGTGGVVDVYTKEETDNLLQNKVDKYENFGVVQVIDNDNAVDNFRSITIDVKYPNEISPLSYQIPTFNWAYEKFSRIEYAIDRIIEIQNELMGVSE